MMVARHTGSVRLFLVAFLLAAGLATPASQARSSAEEFNFFLGHWSIESLDIRPDGTYAKTRALSHAYAFLDGTAIMDEWRSLDGSDKVIFRGASFRTYLPGDRSWQILWMMSGVQGQTVIQARKVGDEIHMEGKGEDPGGRFLERARYHDITPNGYRFSMDRSYDGGATWISPFNEFTATRIESD